MYGTGAPPECEIILSRLKPIIAAVDGLAREPTKMNPKRKLEREAHQLSESARVPFVWFEKESSRSREAVKPTFLRTRNAIAASTFAFTASNSSKFIEPNCFTITPSVNKGAFV
jgi:hypothetical protein